MAKVAVIIYGNIAAGKSTLSEGARLLLPHFDYICQDAIRLEYYQRYPEMNAMARERKCEDALLDHIRTSSNLIYETTGATKLFKRAKRLLMAHNMYMIYVKCSVNECKERYYTRLKSGHRQIAPPYNNMSILSMLQHFNVQHYNITPDLTLDSTQLTKDKMREMLGSFLNPLLK